ncbi:hypothetical protein GDO78_015831 [Eleutherodactylus coqui]|uniref:Uncharacterized protein n=1 Tax=Eleutherodactylus coqui TaxID=57060 RepID=A0A8J6BKE0_ELECQ|nr:hypothetical protein GDO78_015831 [Eleutherodactylus coqui]
MKTVEGIQSSDIPKALQAEDKMYLKHRKEEPDVKAVCLAVFPEALYLDNDCSTTYITFTVSAGNPDFTYMVMR